MPSPGLCRKVRWRVDALASLPRPPSTQQNEDLNGGVLPMVQVLQYEG